MTVAQVLGMLRQKDKVCEAKLINIYIYQILSQNKSNETKYKLTECEEETLSKENKILF